MSNEIQKKSTGTQLEKTDSYKPLMKRLETISSDIAKGYVNYSQLTRLPDVNEIGAALSQFSNEENQRLTEKEASAALRELWIATAKSQDLRENGKSVYKQCLALFTSHPKYAVMDFLKSYEKPFFPVAIEVRRSLSEAVRARSHKMANMERAIEKKREIERELARKKDVRRDKIKGKNDGFKTAGDAAKRAFEKLNRSSVDSKRGL